MRTFVGTLGPVALSLAALLVTPAAGAPQTAAEPARPAAPLAELGIELPTIGGWHWFTSIRGRFFTPAVMADIRDNLHATYVRTGWIPDQFKFETIAWRREDEAMDAICQSGLKTMIIVPTPRNDSKGLEDLVQDVRDFFARYTQREPGCIRYAEITNEADLPKSGFADVRQYAAYYQQVAPEVASFGIPVITSGTSGKDLPWTAELATILRGARPAQPVSGYGFHPYGVAPGAMAAATLEMRRAAAAPGAESLPTVYVTEIAQQRADDLYKTIVGLARATPAITIYEYLPQTGEDPIYGLKDNPARYAAVQRAWADLHSSY